MKNLLLWVSLSFDKPLERSVIMTYIVQPGDSLYLIAMRFNTTVEAIAAANSITNPSLIYPGQILTVPVPNEPPMEGFEYIVQPGDSLYEIAMRYDISLRELIQVNGITAPYIIYPGQSIIIPGVPAPPPPEGGKIYIVKAGDTLYSIAEQFGVPIDAIIKLNNIPRPDLIYP